MGGSYVYHAKNMGANSVIDTEYFKFSLVLKMVERLIFDKLDERY